LRDVDLTGKRAAVHREEIDPGTLRNAIDLRVGESPYIPDLLLEFLSDIGSRQSDRHVHGYGDSRGVDSLRTAISRRYERLYGITIDPDSRILVTNGATEAIWLAVASLTEVGDSIVVPDPSYMAFQPIVAALNRNLVHLPARADNGFRISIPDLLAVMTPRVRMVIIASPENPTGVVYGEESLSEISRFATSHDMFLVHDEVYDDFIYSREHVPAIRFDDQCSRTVMVNSFSKRYGIGGWRLGWMVSNASVIETALALHSTVNLSSAPFLQEAVATALNSSIVSKEILRLSARLGQESRKFVDSLESIEGIACPAGPPDGGFYVFANVSEYAERLNLPLGDRTAGELIADHFRTQHGVIVGPGISFGPSGKDFIRMTFVTPQNTLKETYVRLSRNP
jgi:aspartate/methionine/tyrosine aminotransferase